MSVIADTAMKHAVVLGFKSGSWDDIKDRLDSAAGRHVLDLRETGLTWEAIKQMTGATPQAMRRWCGTVVESAVKVDEARLMMQIIKSAGDAGMGRDEAEERFDKEVQDRRVRGEQVEGDDGGFNAICDLREQRAIEVRGRRVFATRGVVVFPEDKEGERIAGFIDSFMGSIEKRLDDLGRDGDRVVMPPSAACRRRSSGTAWRGRR